MMARGIWLMAALLPLLLPLGGAVEVPLAELQAVKGATEGVLGALDDMIDEIHVLRQAKEAQPEAQCTQEQLPEWHRNVAEEVRSIRRRADTVTDFSAVRQEIMRLAKRREPLMRQVAALASSLEAAQQQEDLPEGRTGIAEDVRRIRQQLEIQPTCSGVEQELSHMAGEREALVRQVAALTSSIEAFSLVSAAQQQDMGLPKDCSDLQRLGAASGESVIYPDGEQPKTVRCEQELHGGGWTVLILRQKQDPQLSFRRNFDEYQEGFGDVNGEHWIGLNTMQQLTSSVNYELMVTMARGAETAVSFYSKFRVAPGSYYRLEVSGFDAANSTGGDSLWYHDGMAFTTQDRDRDQGSGFNCAHVSGHGGNWFNRCHRANPTGLYGGDRSVLSKSDHFLEWRHWQGSHNYLSDFAMMIRPRGSH